MGPFDTPSARPYEYISGPRFLWYRAADGPALSTAVFYGGVWPWHSVGKVRTHRLWRPRCESIVSDDAVVGSQLTVARRVLARRSCVGLGESIAMPMGNEADESHGARVAVALGIVLAISCFLPSDLYAAPIRMAIMGDSISAGSGVTGGSPNWVAQLSSTFPGASLTRTRPLAVRQRMTW